MHVCIFIFITLIIHYYYVVLINCLFCHYYVLWLSYYLSAEILLVNHKGFVLDPGSATPGSHVTIQEKKV